MTGPVWLSIVLLGVALVVVATGGRARRAAPEGRARDRRWVRAVQGELGRAWVTVPWGPAAAGARPTVHGDGAPVEGGWRWLVSTPGAVTVADLEARGPAVASALNARGPLVGALEVRPERGREGWATVAVWRDDPLERSRGIPWDPGTVPDCVPPGWVCFGVGRDGEHVHFPAVGDAGAECLLLAGQRGSGKSAGMLTVAAQLAAWGWAPPILIDTVRHGMDLAVLEPLAACAVITSIPMARAVVKASRDECDRRAQVLRAAGVRCLTVFDERVPLIPIVVDELQGPMGDPRLKVELRLFAQEVRAMGGMVIGATQYPTVEIVDSAFRQQFTNRVAFRCGNQAEGPVILGVTSDPGPHEIRQGPGTAIADVGAGGLRMVRSWWASDRWLRAHVRRLA